MNHLRSSARPEALLEELATSGQPKEFRLYRTGFEDLFERLPAIDATQQDQQEEVAATRDVMQSIADRVYERMDDLRIPDVQDGKFARIILGVEEPKQRDGNIVPGTEIVLALWGKGFQSPVHGHAPGYLHEALIKGSFDVSIFDAVGQAEDRLAVLNHVIEQRTPGIFYSQYNPDAGQEKRSEVVHSFLSRERGTMSLHYLPEHVRNGADNRFAVLGRNLTPVQVDRSQVTRVSHEQAMNSQVGDVYLVRSPTVAKLGDHYILIIGGLVQKKHGLRPNDVPFKAPQDSPLADYGPGELVLLKLDDKARKDFYEHFAIDPKYRKN